MDTRTLNAITGRLSLRAPQEESLYALAKTLDAAPDMLKKERELDSLQKAISAEFPTLTDFEREFPSLCFALATGVGKTRLMGAFISYLHLACGIKNFFVLAPNLTIYNKLIADFTPNYPKYVFKGIAEFAAYPPQVVTGDNYESAATGDILSPVTINIFNIAKINSEIRGGKAPRIKRLRETIGDSYFNYLANLPDLVMLMDESHRYRASAGVRSLNELNPLMGLELTATPFTEGNRGPVPFKNVVVDYPLARAMDDGFVKEPAVVTQRNFNASQYSAERLERIKLEDGIRLHESTKVELFTYAKQQGVQIVKPFMLVIARDTTHAANLLDLLENQLFDSRYKDKVIQVDSSRSGAAEEEMVTRLLAVESFDEPTEIVIHVNMLKEGWDVTNLYTIVPLRAANARTLIEQSIGRGLRLPYGKRTGVDAVDRLSIVAHDRFQEIVDEANNPQNPLRLKQVILEPEGNDAPKEAVVVKPHLQAVLAGDESLGTEYPGKGEKLAFGSERERQVADVALKVLQTFQHKPLQAPTSKQLLNADIQAAITQAVQEQLTGEQQSLLAEQEHLDVAAVVAKTTALMVGQTIDIPRIVVQPIGEITYGYHPFTLELNHLNLQPSNRELISQSLQTNQQISISSAPNKKYQRLEDYIVEHLVDKDDISYDEHAELIYGLASQAVAYFSEAKTYSDDELHNIFFGYGKLLADNIHAQMAAHYWEQASGYEVKVSAGFSPLKEAAFTKAVDQPIHNYRETVAEVGKIKQMLFGGFSNCLYPLQKFDSDTERRFSVILERDAIKWFKPVSGQFQIVYKDGVEHRQYQPDFVAELDSEVLMVETKARNELDDAIVQAKAEAAREYCKNASDYLQANGGKRWRYVLVAHDEVTENRAASDF
ncbi:MAG: DEAD/DEAH box helicase family protein [Porticoccus sp.]|jgi:type III restriction enzyme|uniref:DEAD/DEAH box helicase family protein n=1 Tax=Porticoccus sp. TaxID=2024853 RepID=UPI000C4A5282|nr:DEAD/DEAH box helicase family protein [Porticoccus sp.]MAZ69540.1 type III restriction endonuclease subunit R [Porticoccus sp.]|tara:strand:+ start:7581 stop:10241 length:2661 start_codon:yes stop_codon:yes gene_type:complete